MSPLMTALVAPAGTYRLRVAATDGAGRGGTADYEIVAELAAAGPVRLSGLVLGLSRAGSFGPRLQFGAEPVAIGYLEVYGKVEAAVSATFELAASLNGQAIVRVPGAVTQTADADRHLVTAALPIGALQPGDYVVRVIVGVQGQPTGRVIRTLRKVLK